MKQKSVKVIDLPEKYLNKITIQEKLKHPESCLYEPVNINITHDVSIIMDTVNTLGNEEPVSPLPSIEKNSTYSMLNPVVPRFGREYQNSLHHDERYHLLNSDERRKHRNREAS